MPHELPESGAGPVPMNDLGETLGVESNVLAEYLDLGLVGAGRFCPSPTSLSAPDLARLSRALRLADELELHAAAALLLVELLEERDTLLRRVSRLERMSADAA
jgi:hypothetical protein